jgi:leucyl/phenylalanyl-tRNA--protein transferase
LPIYRLHAEFVFPDPAQAEEDGLLAIGGGLEPERLLLAYRNGIFPWYEEGLPILWHSPDPRCILYPSKLRLTKSFRQAIRNGGFELRFDSMFRDVIELCAAVPREGQRGTWITEEMIEAYCKLHELGYAHSVEAFKNDKLVGGLYGIALKSVFCGESMFSLESNASKICLAALCGSFQWSFIDCQVYNEHLGRLGAEEIPRSDFLESLRKQVEGSINSGSWKGLKPEFPIET